MSRRTSSSPRSRARRPRLGAGHAARQGRGGGFQSLRVGFRGKELAAIEIVDSFGQRSLLQFSEVATNVTPAADTFRFTPPKGADVIEQ